eukprot:1189751-Rhodomonas_salina.2
MGTTKYTWEPQRLGQHPALHSTTEGGRQYPELCLASKVEDREVGEVGQTLAGLDGGRAVEGEVGVIDGGDDDV